MASVASVSSDPSRRPLPSRPALRRLLDEAFVGPAWHGASLRIALRGVTPEQALWRPGLGRPNVWEQALHCAIGKLVVANRLDPGRRQRFPRPLARAWWAPSPELTDARALARAWRDDLALLDALHQHLLAVLQRTSATRLRTRHGSGRFLLGEQVAGLALHDAYHAGQIALALRLAAGGDR